VLHRLLAGGSDRAAERWPEDYLIPGTEGLELHHLYRAMVLLGEAIEELEKPTGAVRCTKDLVGEALFDRRRDLFTEVELVFFDTTSLYFEGQGGEIGKRGITDLILSRWWLGWLSMWRVARFVVRCGPATVASCSRQTMCDKANALIRTSPENPTFWWSEGPVRC
jgi:hypothetical protein